MKTLQLTSYILEWLNKNVFDSRGTPISSLYRLLPCENGQRHDASLDNFKIVESEEMPKAAAFDDLFITPLSGTVLKTICRSSQRKMFINIVHHDSIPLFPLTDPYMLLCNDRVFCNGAEHCHECTIFDLVLNTATWEHVRFNSAALNMVGVLLSESVLGA